MHAKEKPGNAGQQESTTFHFTTPDKPTGETEPSLEQQARQRVQARRKAGNGEIPPTPATTEPTITADRPLEVLAAEINLAHREARDYAGQAIERALQAGDLLITVKSRLNHGEFGPWCATNCPDISRRTIQNYMRVARELPAEKRIDAHLGLNQALRLIASAEEDEEASSANLLPSPDQKRFLDWCQKHDAKPLPSPDDPFVLPWRRPGDKTRLAAIVRAYPDLLMGAAVYMDAEGKASSDIAAELGVFTEEVDPFLTPILPPLEFKDFSESAVTTYYREGQRFIYHAQAEASYLAWSCAYLANNTALAESLRAINNVAVKAYNRLPPPKDLLVRFIGQWMGQAAVGVRYLPTNGFTVVTRALHTIECLFDYEIFELMPEWGKLVDKEPEALRSYYEKKRGIIESIEIPYDRLGTATLEELQREKREIWERQFDILHARRGAE